MQNNSYGDLRKSMYLSKNQNIQSPRNNYQQLIGNRQTGSISLRQQNNNSQQLKSNKVQMKVETKQKSPKQKILEILNSIYQINDSYLKESQDKKYRQLYVSQFNQLISQLSQINYSIKNSKLQKYLFEIQFYTLFNRLPKIQKYVTNLRTNILQKIVSCEKQKDKQSLQNLFNLGQALIKSLGIQKKKLLQQAYEYFYQIELPYIKIKDQLMASTNKLSIKNRQIYELQKKLIEVQQRNIRNIQRSQQQINTLKQKIQIVNKENNRQQKLNKIKLNNLKNQYQLKQSQLQQCNILKQFQLRQTLQKRQSQLKKQYQSKQSQLRKEIEKKQSQLEKEYESKQQNLQRKQAQLQLKYTSLEKKLTIQHEQKNKQLIQQYQLKNSQFQKSQQQKYKEKQKKLNLQLKNKQNDLQTKFSSKQQNLISEFDLKNSELSTLNSKKLQNLLQYIKLTSEILQTVSNQKHSLDLNSFTKKKQQFQTKITSAASQLNNSVNAKSTKCITDMKQITINNIQKLYESRVQLIKIQDLVNKKNLEMKGLVKNCTDYENLSNLFSTVKANEEHSKQVNNYKDKIDDLKSQLIRNKQQLVCSQDQIIKLQSKVSELTNNLNKLKQGEQNKIVSRLEQAINYVRRKQNNLRESLRIQANKSQDIQINGDYAKVVDKIKSMSSEIQQLKNEKKQLTELIDGKAQQNKVISTQNDKLEKQNKSQALRIEQLSSQIIEFKIRQTSDQGKIGDLQNILFQINKMQIKAVQSLNKINQTNAAVVDKFNLKKPNDLITLTDETFDALVQNSKSFKQKHLQKQSILKNIINLFTTYQSINQSHSKSDVENQKPQQKNQLQFIKSEKKSKENQTQQTSQSQPQSQALNLLLAKIQCQLLSLNLLSSSSNSEITSSSLLFITKIRTILNLIKQEHNKIVIDKKFAIDKLNSQLEQNKSMVKKLNTRNIQKCLENNDLTKKLEMVEKIGNMLQRVGTSPKNKFNPENNSPKTPNKQSLNHANSTRSQRSVTAFEKTKSSQSQPTQKYFRSQNKIESSDKKGTKKTYLKPSPINIEEQQAQNNNGDQDLKEFESPENEWQIQLQDDGEVNQHGEDFDEEEVF